MVEGKIIETPNFSFTIMEPKHKCQIGFLGLRYKTQQQQQQHKKKKETKHTSRERSKLANSLT